jgi:hypothetical protein
MSATITMAQSIVCISDWMERALRPGEYYEDEEFVSIEDAAEHMFDIKVNHEFTYYEAGTLAGTGYNDHMYAGKLTIKVNGEDVGDEWMHDVDDSVDTNTDYYYNDVTQEYGYTINTEYDDLVEVRMDCTNDCVCTFEKTD